MSKEEKELWNKSKELTSKKYKSKEELENRVFILETQLKNDIKMLEIKQNKINKQKEVLDKIKDFCMNYIYIDDRGEELEELEKYIDPKDILELLEEIE
jgi:ribonuclease HII